jgi:hypothetical protein
MKCKNCGSVKLQRRGKAIVAGVWMQRLFCNDCRKCSSVPFDDSPATPVVPVVQTEVEPLVLRDKERQIAKLRDTDKSKDKLIAALEEQVEQARKRGEILEALRNSPRDSRPFKVRTVSEGNEATAVIVLSDTHIEERVDLDKVNGLNEYNPEIAQARIERVMQNAIIMVKQQQREIEINTIVLAVLGDIITGYIHDDLVETNYMAPVKAILLAQDILENCIDLLVQNTKCNIIVVCTPGNHGRTTEKRRVQSYAENSFEYLLYMTLQKYYRSNKRVEFRITEAYHNYLDVYGYIVRFHHGDFMQYGGGIGGITIPVNKSIAQWNQAVKADLDVFGHWHQLTFAKNFVSNGSTIGFNQYAISIKAGFEPPQQAFFLIDKKRKRYTLSCPLFTE